MFPGEAKAGVKTASTVRTQHTLTILANVNEGQTRKIIDCEHDGQNAHSLILDGDTEAGIDIKVGVNLVCASDAQTPLGLIHKGSLSGIVVGILLSACTDYKSC